MELSGSSSLEAAEAVFERIEQAVLDLDGIERVESSFQEIGGTVTVHLDPDARDGATPARVRDEVRLATRGLPGVEVSNANLAAGEQRRRRRRRQAVEVAAAAGASAGCSAERRRRSASRGRTWP